MVANTTAIGQVFERVTGRFDGMCSRRAFVHWFVNTGMEEAEIYTARENLTVLEADYEEACGSETASVLPQQPV